MRELEGEGGHRPTDRIARESGPVPITKAILTIPLLSALPLAAAEFEPPVRLQAGGEFIDTEIGHAAPSVGDFDRDGVRDLLVGQFGGGHLWIFRNEGTDAEPKLAKGQLFDGTVQDGWKGYLEDRRPASNAGPYKVVRRICQTVNG